METVKSLLINYLQNFSALRIVHGYKMNDDEYIFYTAGLRALTTEFQVLEVLNRISLKNLESQINDGTTPYTYTGEKEEDDDENEEPVQT